MEQLTFTGSRLGAHHDIFDRLVTKFSPPTTEPFGAVSYINTQTGHLWLLAHYPDRSSATAENIVYYIAMEERMPCADAEHDDLRKALGLPACEPAEIVLAYRY